jgi:hypothetical protein
MLISLLLVTFVCPYCSSILNIYVGSKLSNDLCISYIRLYCIYIFLFGLNVITESYNQSIMSIKQRNIYQNILLFYSFIFLVLSYFLIKSFSIYGIIIVNSLNMLGRILINQYFSRFKWSNIRLFSSHYIFILFLSFILCCLSKLLIQDSFGCFIFGIGLFLTIICLTWIEEKEMIHYFYCIIKLNNH